MFIVSWIFDKLGYMPKISVESTWPFPATQKDYVAPEFERPIKKREPGADEDFYGIKRKPVVAKKKPAAKKVVAKKTVRKKA